jgi:integrase/recombinase XerD
MTCILHRDPDRRCKPLHEWPEVDRLLWLAGLVPGDLFEEGGSRARFTDETNRRIVNSYGRWLQWLDRHSQMTPIDSPGDRISPDRVRAYLADLERHSATQTVINRLIDLSMAARVMDPGRDWSWIQRLLRPIQARHNLGLGLMAAAERKNPECRRATAYRDGLLIALLAVRPLRMRNLVGLTLDRTLVLRGEQWWIQIPAGETKTRKPIELPWPEPLVASLEVYLASHRPVLAQRHGRWARSVGQAVWLSNDGSPMTRRGIYDRITRCTLKGLGKTINPHLFRDCSATTIALDDVRRPIDDAFRAEPTRNAVARRAEHRPRVVYNLRPIARKLLTEDPSLLD